MPGAIGVRMSKQNHSGETEEREKTNDIGDGRQYHSAGQCRVEARRPQKNRYYHSCECGA